MASSDKIKLAQELFDKAKRDENLIAVFERLQALISAEGIQINDLGLARKAYVEVKNRYHERKACFCLWRARKPEKKGDRERAREIKDHLKSAGLTFTQIGTTENEVDELIAASRAGDGPQLNVLLEEPQPASLPSPSRIKLPRYLKVVK